MKKIAAMIVRMARDNSSWGYCRIGRRVLGSGLWGPGAALDRSRHRRPERGALPVRVLLVGMRVASRRDPSVPDPCFPLLARAPRPWLPVPGLALLVGEPEAVYRPRHPERTVLYRLFERHFDDYVRTHEERFERTSGPLRPVVLRTVEAYLDCGRLFGGFARLRCPKCEGEHLLALSCQTGRA